MAISKSFIKYTIWTTLRTIYILFGNSKLSLKKHLKKKYKKNSCLFPNSIFYKRFGHL